MGLRRPRRDGASRRAQSPSRHSRGTSQTHRSFAPTVPTGGGDQRPLGAVFPIFRSPIWSTGDRSRGVLAPAAWSRGNFWGAGIDFDRGVWSVY